MLVKINVPKHYEKLHIILNRHTLGQVKSMHYLGVDVDESLTWEASLQKSSVL